MKSAGLVRVGVVGGGIWGNMHLLASRELESLGIVELKAISARTEETSRRRASEFGISGYTDYRKMMDDEKLDAITVATPDHLHREVVLEALGRGMHVLVEKPMDLSAAGCREMIAAAQKNQLLLEVDFHKRYDANNIDARARVRAGDLGDLQYAHAYIEDKIVVPTEWLSGWAAHSSPFWFIGVHKYDLVRWITGRDAVSVCAHARKGKLTSMGIDTYDSVSTSLLMDGGLTCTIDVNWILPKEFDATVNQGFRLVGSTGIIEINARERGLSYGLASGGMQKPNVYSLLMQDTPYGWKSVGGYFVEPIKHFLLNVLFLKRGGNLERLSGQYPSGYDGLKVTEVAEAVDRSIKESQPVTLETSKTSTLPR